MIKVKVISIFKDIYTNEIYPLNKVLEVTEERYSEMKDFVIKINKNEKTSKVEGN